MNTQEFKRKLTAVFSADVAGYSRLMGEDEAATVKTLESYKQIMFSLIKQHRGRVIDSPGDNLLAEFASVVDAVQCGVAVQNELKARNTDLPENRKMQFRIGINLGDVIEEQDRIYGDGVNIAARLESCADPGGICVSKTAFDHIETKLPLGYEYLGEKEVKNIAKPVGVYRVLMEPRVTVAGAKENKPSIPVWKRKGALAGAVAVLVVVVAVGLWNFYWRAPRIEPASKEKMAFPLPDKPSIAVLPFANMTGDVSQEFLVDGLTETIITALARVPQLFVIARESSFSYKGKRVRVQQVAEELGVQYVLEGSVQRSGDKVRITAQFIDALNGRHLWAAQYDRDMKNVFQLSDDVTAKVLPSVYLKLSGGGELRLYRSKGPKDMEAFLKCLELIEAMRGLNPKDNATAKRLGEELIAMDPEWSAGPSMLARAYYMDVFLGVSDSPKESLAKALELAKKAVAMDESNPNNHNTLGYVLSMMKENEQALAEFERASALCPSCSDPYMYTGYIQYCMDDTDKAIASLQTALRLNPYPPTYYYGNMGNAYRHAGRYEEAISWYKKSLQISPNAQGQLVGLVSCYSLLGREEEARTAAQQLLRVNPKFSVEVWAKTMPYRNQEKLALFADALRKAGLPDKPPLPLPDKPSIAVLPFVNMSEDKSQEYFSDGLTEEIITALSKTPKLFVIARNSSFVYKGKPVNVQQVSRELGVKYVLEGSVRRSGDQLRITAQLIDATTGNHLWAERYDREMKDIFAIQDEITMKIVGSCLQLTTAEMGTLRGRYPSNLQAYLKLLEGMGYNYGAKFSDAMRSFEEALSLDPHYPPTYAWLAWAHMWNVWFGPSATRGQSLEKAFQFAEKAKALDDKSFAGPNALGHAYLLKRDYDKALYEGKLATELAPNSAVAATNFGWTLRSVGRYEEAMKEYERALRLDPLNTDHTLTQMGTTYLMMRRYQESISSCKKALQRNPRFLAAHITLAMAYSLLGNMEEAREASSEVLKLSPNFSVEHFAKALPYKNEADREFMADALRNAGLK